MRPLSLRFRQSIPLALGVGLLVVSACTTANSGEAGEKERYDVTPRRVSLIAPGTVIGEKAPKGWSHLIIRSHPRVAEEDVSKVNSLTAKLASFLFTAMVAKVEPVQEGGETRYRFRDVGVGFGTSIDGKYTIISPDTEADLGANLSFFARQVLSTCYEEQKAGLIICHSDTMAIVDTRVVLDRDGRHRWCAFRHAMLIDPRNGALATLQWPIDLDDSGRYLGAAGPVEWLPPNKVEDSVLRVDSDEFTLGVPSKKAFAVAHMPKGIRRLEFPKPEVARLVSSPRMTEESAYATEMWLWEMIRLATEKDGERRADRGEPQQKAR